jgi:hypothetical protein
MHPQKTLALTFLDIRLQTVSCRPSPTSRHSCHRDNFPRFPGVYDVEDVRFGASRTEAAGFTGPRTEILGEGAVQRTSYGWKM